MMMDSRPQQKWLAKANAVRILEEKVRILPGLPLNIEENMSNNSMKEPKYPLQALVILSLPVLGVIFYLLGGWLGVVILIIILLALWN